MSTSLSRRTFVLFRYDPCVKTVYERPLNASRLSSAARIIRSVRWYRSSSESLVGLDQARKTDSQLSTRVPPYRYSGAFDC